MTQSTKSILPLLCLGLVGTGFDFALHAPDTEAENGQVQNSAPIHRVVKSIHHKLSAGAKQG